MATSSTLEQYITAPLKLALGQTLTGVFYHDVAEKQWLTTNFQGTDIIAQQVELIFGSGLRLYCGWDTVKEWSQYSLCVSQQSFCLEAIVFTASPDYWQQRIGKPLTSYSVYGYKESTWHTAGGSVERVHLNEPHLIVLHFDSSLVAVANYTAEEDFHPRFPFGDDVWILFEQVEIEEHIQRLGFDKLEA
ncbi:hypothetical protein [Hymenobacter psychrotolerans]|uniref:Uncharacterized protein n=1 Tax=Hymenobacter psychrotolerans DSM 18569 TaxID=1121959 RepID=A0A1M6Y7A0_9BACT|nr:hypothetical protein [Hymenobacter psychrotolerans]SHL13909.1 hypothetical protein SAMN02746009_02206 [Hymenobacter psychrotolerans DSM 18569]